MDLTRNQLERDGSTFSRYILAVAFYCAIALSIAGPALFGKGSLIPEGVLDHDPLLSHPGIQAKLRPFEDPTPIVLELGRAQAIAEGLGHGRLNTWNPWSGAGAPLWAEQGGPFFPTNALFYLWPSHTTWMLALASRLVVAAIGMFALALALGLRFPAALFAGAVFEYSGILAAELSYANASAIYMLPWVLLAAHKLWLGAGHAYASVAFAGTVLGLTLLGGHPGQNLIACVGFGAWFVGAGLQQRPSAGTVARVAARAAASVVLAILVAGAGLMPFLELVMHGHSYKNTGLSEAIWLERLGWTRNVIAPGAFMPSLITAARDGIAFNHWPWAAGASIGLASLMLAIVGLPRLREHWAIAAVGVMGVALVISPPGLRWVHQVPGLSILLPWYCYPLLVAPACLLAAFGLQELGRGPRRRVAILAYGAVLVGTVATLLTLSSDVTRIFDFHRYRTPLNAHLAEPIKYSLNLLSVACATLALMVYLAGARRSAHKAAALCALVALIEAAAVRIPTITYERSAALERGQSAATKQLAEALKDGLWRFAAFPPVEIGTPNSSALHRLRDFRSFSALAIRRHTSFLNLSGPIDADPWSHPQWQYPRSLAAVPLNLASVRYVLWGTKYPVPEGYEGDGLTDLQTIDQVRFYENPYALPRIRIARDVVPAKTESDAFDALSRLVKTLEPSRWENTVVLEGELGDALPANVDPQHSGLETVRLVSEPDTQTVVVETNLASPAILVINDTYYPGWTAKVNGQAAAIHPANLMFRGVAISAGRSIVEMSYEPLSLRIGVAMSVLGILAVVAILYMAHDGNRPKGFSN